MRITTLALAIAGLLVAVPAAAVDRLVDDGLVPCVHGGLPIHRTISEALAVASDGETIVVCAGTYREAVHVFVGVTLQNKGQVKLVGPRPEQGGHGIVVEAPNVTIRGFEISGFDGCGVFGAGNLGSVFELAVIGNRVHDNGAGICVLIADLVRVMNNLVEGNATDGINLFDPAGGEISGNRIVDNGAWGIAVSDCYNTPTIERNFLAANADGIRVVNVNRDVCDPVIRRNRLQGPGAATSGTGIMLGEKVTSAVVTENHIRSYATGVQLCCNFSGILGPMGTLSYNRLSANGVGIDLHEVVGVTLTRNQVLRSTTVGIDVRESTGGTLTRNHVSHSGIVDCRWDGFGVHEFDANQCRTEEPPGTFD